MARSPSAPSSLSTATKLATPGARVKLLHLQERLTCPSRSGVVVDIETRKEALDFAMKMQAELRELGVDA